MAQYIRSHTHLDIGADHARLPLFLLHSNQAQKVLVVEKSPRSYANSLRALSRFMAQGRAECRLGDGFDPVNNGEVNSVSLCGFGASSMVKVLKAHPQRLPRQVVAQPNHSAHLLRLWAQDHGWWLLDERLVHDQGFYWVMNFAPMPGPDPVYQGGFARLASAFGPHLLQRKDPLLFAYLQQQQQRLAPLALRNPQLQPFKLLVEQALELMG